MGSGRDNAIDVMRGIAIITMVAANMSPFVLVMPPPLWFRFYGTFAAPLFIMLSGLMIAFKGEAGEHDLKYYLLRGLMVLLVAIGIDLFVWQSWPIIGMDVLCLIGLSLPLAFLFLRLSTRMRWIIIVAIFLLTPVLQNVFEYREFEMAFSRTRNTIDTNISKLPILKSWFVDGWFPIFPWLAFSFLGPVLQKLRLKSASHFGNWRTFFIGFMITVFGGAFWAMNPGELYIRDNFSELFYPPTIGYILSSIGVMVTLFSVIDLRPDLKFYGPIRALGEASLFMYILHLVIIRYILADIWTEQDILSFSLIYICFMVFLALTAYGLRLLRHAWPARPFIVKFLMG